MAQRTDCANALPMGIEGKEIREATTTRNSSGNTEMCIKPANKNHRNHREKVTKGERDEGKKKEKGYIHA